ncbi:hypothetical protein U9J35_10290 [Rossellomorea aquimaris]|nr:hypothetical protein [Rossellomorea aquimaris]WRP08522.1 hypothetical protein U9J35_10290 [Rossellomorea aquimaris]
MTEEEYKLNHGTEYPELMNDIHMISEEIQSLYNHYSKRIKNVSEELSRERSKHLVYQSEIAENHHTILMLTEQIEFLLQNIEMKYELDLELQQELMKKSLSEETELPNDKNFQVAYKEESIQDNSKDVHLAPTPIPEVKIFYESAQGYMKSPLEKIKNEAISLLIEANEYFMSEKKILFEVEVYNNVFVNLIDWLRMHRKQYMRPIKERWYTIVWKFLWGKEEENNHPEILKKLNLIEEQLVSHSMKFNEVKETLIKSNESEETTKSYLQKISVLNDELKKIEEYYEDELHSLKDQLEDYKQREKDLEKEVSLLNQKYTGNQKEKSNREAEMEKELDKLKKDLQSRSNKKKEIYQNMKQQQKKQASHVNPQFDEYGNIPMASESKRTMFNPNKYMR